MRYRKLDLIQQVVFFSPQELYVNSISGLAHQELIAALPPSEEQSQGQQSKPPTQKTKVIDEKL